MRSRPPRRPARDPPELQRLLRAEPARRRLDRARVRAGPGLRPQRADAQRRRRALRRQARRARARGDRVAGRTRVARPASSDRRRRGPTRRSVRPGDRPARGREPTMIGDRAARGCPPPPAPPGREVEESPAARAPAVVPPVWDGRPLGSSPSAIALRPAACGPAAVRRGARLPREGRRHATRSVPRRLRDRLHGPPSLGLVGRRVRERLDACVRGAQAVAVRLDGAPDAHDALDPQELPVVALRPRAVVGVDAALAVRVGRACGPATQPTPRTSGGSRASTPRASSGPPSGTGCRARAAVRPRCARPGSPRPAPRDPGRGPGSCPRRARAAAGGGAAGRGRAAGRAGRPAPAGGPVPRRSCARGR